MLLCCMAATLMLACSNDKSGGHDGDEESKPKSTARSSTAIRPSTDW